MVKKKKNDPAFLFYPASFLAETTDLDWEEKGQYITMLSLQFIHGHLKPKIIELNISKIESISSQILDKFSIDKDGNFYSKELDILIKNRQEYSTKQRENACKRWEKEVMPSHIPNGMPDECQNDTKDDAKSMPALKDVDVDVNINKNIDLNIDIFSYIETNFGRTLSPVEYEEIQTWEDTELTRYAISQSILRGVRNLKYISRTLESYKANSISTVSEAQVAENQHKKKTEQSKGQNRLERNRQIIDEVLGGDDDEE